MHLQLGQRTIYQNITGTNQYKINDRLAPTIKLDKQRQVYIGMQMIDIENFGIISIFLNTIKCFWYRLGF